MCRFKSGRFDPLRRRVLVGAGKSILALPFLEILNWKPLSAYAQKSESLKFLICYFPMGIHLDQWFRNSNGRIGYAGSVSNGFKTIGDRILPITGLDNLPGHGGVSASRVFQASNSPHAMAGYSFLTCQNPYSDSGATSIDRRLAKHFGSRSVHIGCDQAYRVPRSNETLNTQKYARHISWENGSQIQKETSPQRLFKRFIDSASNVSAEQRVTENLSLIDPFVQSVKDLQPLLGREDRQVLDQYLENIRSVERTLSQEKSRISSKRNEFMKLSTARIDDIRDHARILFDVSRILFQADVTRVITFSLSDEFSYRTYNSELGISENHHALSHSTSSYGKQRLNRICRLHVDMFVEAMEEWSKTKTPSGDLLANVLSLYGSGTSDPNAHTKLNLPVVLAGGESTFKTKTGKQIHYNGPLSDLYLTIAQRSGLNLRRFSDSKGAIDGVFS